ncbi:hypothetical protein [uncultured Gammaproteobacteria bacterium]|nr:hypothetical protein [uncultured Gammaproteobacteria bacterium]
MQNLIIKASNKSVNPFSSPAKGGSIILTLPSSRLIRGTLTCRWHSCSKKFI